MARKGGRIRIVYPGTGRVSAVYLDGGDISNMVTSVKWTHRAGEVPTVEVTMLDVQTPLAVDSDGEAVT